MRLDLSAPDYTTLSRRSQHLRRRLRPVPPGEAIHLVLDSTGLSIVGEGEWAAAPHGGRGRRGWRKLHLGVDQSGVILVHTLTEATGDDATTALDLLTAVEGPLVRNRSWYRWSSLVLPLSGLMPPCCVQAARVLVSKMSTSPIRLRANFRAPSST